MADGRSDEPASSIVGGGVEVAGRSPALRCWCRGAGEQLGDDIEDEADQLEEDLKGG